MRLVLGSLRVQDVRRSDGGRSYTIVWPEGAVHAEADRFLRTYEESGTQRTYAYLLVDHLRWLEREALALEAVSLSDLQRYMAAIGAKARGPYGEPWRVGKKPYGPETLSTAASAVKGFYLHQAGLGINEELGAQLARTRLPTKADRNRALLGHVTQNLPANPLAPRRVRRRHPKMQPEGARDRLLEAVRTARDWLAVTWLADGGFRIGELCGLHLADLHLRDRAGCGECHSPHVHVCHRELNPNEARAKTKYPWSVEDGIVRGGLIKRVSPAMIHTYFEYMTSEYPAGAAHGMLLVQLHGPDHGEPWTTAGARGMLSRAGKRAELGRIRPHGFRHEFATAVLEASGGNLLVARDAGGWASTAVVDEIYAHVDIHDPVFDGALRKVWGLA
ncbi:tyrosine-type recombinase/integrase [Streptosporangium sp. NBC_01810]|uniref:tyrosine-type recombinase/integrase n=1 Tax=Streptosporangium sp. NBC_01810 TaxID=2975951 RepID=UPI002DDA21B8|nr:tyrosine-type recombinase/integrase [Streptosporangium sp. NBC_01810]WSA28594.1 tyrosine-type recombinase/integrase [Streptosporangium sp. NBC_01810]